MARTITNATLQSRAARARLRAQHKPHWMALRPGELSLGYAKCSNAAPGYWTVRTYIGSVATVAEGVRGGKSPYRIKRLPGVADDYEDANGDSVLSFRQAQDLALAPPPKPVPSGPMTVAHVCASYIKYLEDEGRDRAAVEAEYRARRHILPVFRDTKVTDLTPQALRGWLAGLAKKLTKGKTDETAVRKSRVSANRIMGCFRA